jgi:hypothetical protein
MNFGKKRLKEASTWAGIAAIFQAATYLFPQHAAVLHAGTVIAGCVAGAVPEKGSGRGAEVGAENGSHQ